MILFKKNQFSFEDKDYEIRILYNDTLINVVAFHNNYPANGLRHQIQILKKYGVEEFLKKEPVQELAEMAKRDIIEKRWERLHEGIEV